MNEYDLIKQKINYVLDSDLTNYRISVMLGDKSANHVSRLRKGTSDVDDITLNKIKRFLEIYNELQEEK